MKDYQSREVDMEGRRVIPSLSGRWSSLFFFVLRPCVQSLCSCPEFFHWICMPINYWYAGPLTIQASDLMREKGGGHTSPQVTLWFLTCQGESVHLNPLELFLRNMSLRLACFLAGTVSVSFLCSDTNVVLQQISFKMEMCKVACSCVTKQINPFISVHRSHHQQISISK